MNSQIFFGEKLRTLRIQNNLSQKDLAEKLGISTSSVGMYEQSRRQIPGKYLVKICEIFHVSSEYFLEAVQAAISERVLILKLKT